MSYVPPHLRKSSTPWDRLKPVKQDPLEAMGYVSKGDNRLLDPKAQESFYNKIVTRYMQFCSQHSKNLDNAFVSLSLNDEHETRSTTRGTSAKALAPGESRPLTPSPPKNAPILQNATSIRSDAAIATELSTILTGLRKLREGLLASSTNASSPVFSQRVHVFNIRLAVLALHPPSYHPSLLHLLFILHTPAYPLPRSELVEMTTYLIIDMATRQDNLGNAHALRYNSKMSFDFQSRTVDIILRAVATGNWVSFWSIRRKVDGYIRAILHWQTEKTRRSTLKVIGRSYLTCDIKWILASTCGNELSWEKLVKAEEVAWIRDHDKVIIRKPKPKVP